MQREQLSKDFTSEELRDLKLKAWRWGQSFKHSIILENNNISFPYNAFPNVIAVGNSDSLDTPSRASFFDQLKELRGKNKDYLFGSLSYDLKNQIENLESNNPSFQTPKEGFFFIPESILFFSNNSVTILTYLDPQVVYNEIQATEVSVKTSTSSGGTVNGIKREKYINNVNKIKQHILEGDIYELNYCIEFSHDHTIIDPLATFIKLIEKSPMPFSFFSKNDDDYIICSSPERFLKKQGDKLISQPIKGTIKRGSDADEDRILKERLRNSEKERAENLMIVDLVRNDLAKSSAPGTVKVEELFGIYTFNQLHQMISTITSEKKKEVDPIDAIKNAFPMGSMTGAPKIRAMELIETCESSARGAFSGAGGYFTPSGDFDFNVIIRSIFYNSSSKRLSFQVGSAITYDSDPEYEYEECLLKAKAIFHILNVDLAESE